MKARWPVTMMREVLEVSQRVLQLGGVAAAPRQGPTAQPQRRSLAGAYPCHSRATHRRVRLAADAQGAAGPRGACGQGTGTPADAAVRHSGQGQEEVRGVHRQPSPLAGGAGPGAAPLHAGRTQPRVEWRHHLPAHRRGLAVPGRSAGSAQPSGGVLEPAVKHADRAGQGCFVNGLLPSQACRRTDLP